VSHVVASVSKYAAAIRRRRRIPIPKYDSVCKLPEGSGKRDEECRWHDKSVFVHGEVVMNAMEEEMQGDSHAVVRQMSAYC
jgi:hypothetical protein